MEISTFALQAARNSLKIHYICKNDVVMPNSEIQQVIPIIRDFFKNEPVERAFLFGSCSRGEETPDSDIDLLVKYTEGSYLSLLDISRLMVNLSRKINRKVDLVEEGRLKTFAVDSVNRDKIKIYERAD